MAAPASPDVLRAPAPAVAARDATAVPRLDNALRFGRFELLASERLLRADGEVVPLRARALDLLVVLAMRPGQLVTRQQLLDRVWPGLVVEGNNLSVQINALRKVLGADTILTVPGHGYRLAIPVERTDLMPHAVTAARPVMHDGQAPLERPAAAQPQTNLPNALPALVGRDAELVALGNQVDQHNLVTLLGAGGMGKTRLSQAVLHARRDRYTHGVCFVDLAPLARASAVLDTIAAALGLPQPGGDEPLAGLLRSMEALHLLMVLDNAEHVLDAVAGFAAALRGAAPGVHVLVTSQAPLQVAEEWLFRLGALAIPDEACTAETALQFGAVALFARRAQAQNQRFQVDQGNVAQVVELCRRLGGAPLAIELAAARMSTFGLPKLLAAMDDGLGVLRLPRRDAPARQQSLQAALQWTHGLLDGAAQRVFRRLAVFVGSASLAALVQLVVDDAPGGLEEWAVLDALTTLVDGSLVEVMDVDGADDSPRYRHHAVPLVFARELLQRAGEAPAMRRRHAEVMAALLSRARDDLFAGRIAFTVWQATIAVPDIDNGLAALRWALDHDTSLALALAPALSRAMLGWRHADGKALWAAVEPLLDAALAETAETAETAEMADRAPPAAVLAQAATECAYFWVNSRLAHALLRARQGQALAQQAGDTTTQALAAHLVAWGFGVRGDEAGLMPALATLASLLAPPVSAYLSVVTSQARLWAPMLRSDAGSAVAELRHQVALVKAAGMPDGAMLANLAEIMLDAGEAEASLALVGRLLEASAHSRSPGMRRHQLNVLVRACLTLGRLDEARQALHAFLPLAQRFDMLGQWADGAALLAALEGRFEMALKLLGFADAAFAAGGTPRQKQEAAMADRADQLARAGCALAGQASLAQDVRLPATILPDDALLG